MAESAPVELPEVAEAGPTACRTVRRRLVQATLFPPNPLVIEPSRNQEDRNCVKDKDNECEEACGSQKKQRRKRVVKASPQKKASSGKVSVQATLFPQNPLLIEPAANQENVNCSKDEDDECEEACGSQKKQRRKRVVKESPQKRASSGKVSVQATLFPQNPLLIVPAANQENVNCSKDEDDECEEACGSQKKQRRKRVVKESPQKRASSGKVSVQATLFPQNPLLIEPDANQENVNCSKDEDDECDEVCGSQKKRRKRMVKASPQKKASPGKKEKQPVNGTPKKRKLLNPVETGNKSPPVPNLRLEAKLTAEENSRIFAGRKVHPFFSLCKAGRRSQEFSSVEEGSTLSKTKNRRITLGPIHVLDGTQVDSKMLLDWRDWEFCESVLVGDAYSSDSTSSAFDGKLSHLTFDELPCLREISPTNSAELLNEEVPSCSLSKCSTLDHDTSRVYPVSIHADNLRKLDVDQQCKFLEERMVHYYAGSCRVPSDSLWTDKFHPKRSIEVCGNDESVKFLSEWLHLWLQRDHQNSKHLNGVNGSSFLDDSYKYQSDNSDSEYTEEETGLKNVMLVTGPVGCGKSAAIYACAKEQGFDIMEVNASECRNGALVKQRFGEALESQWLKWSSADAPKEDKFHPALPQGPKVAAINNEIMAHIPIPDESYLSDATGADKSRIKDNGGACELRKVKPLILFEDVDITFLEDRGFIAAVQHIAETAKGPLILTTNNENLVLPESLDRLELFFKMPSRLELLAHAYMVCVSEKATVHPHVAERFIECCKGDIRKTIMQLQFWFQGDGYVKGKKSERVSSELLDLDSGHGILPKLMPWSFPSELSELVERESSLALSMMEERSNLVEIVEEDFDCDMLGSQEIDLNEESLEAKKEAMLSRNCSIQNEEFAAQINISWDFSSSPGTPVSFSRKKAGRKLDIVLSSDSEADTHIDQSADINGNDQLDCVSNDICLTPMIDKSSEEHKCLPYLDIESRNQIDNFWRADDVSCVPESTYVPETEIDYGNEVSCNTLSTFQVDKMTDYPSPDKTGNVGKSLNRIRKLSDLAGNSCNKTAKYYAEEEDTLYDCMHAVASNHVMDECSRIDFKRNVKPINQCDLVPNLVQEYWKRFRATQSKKDTSTEQKNAMRVLEIVSRMTDFISEADILLHKCNEVIDDFPDPTAFITEKPELFSWSSCQHQIASTMFEHGFCSFAKDLDVVEVNLDKREKLDLAKEMLSLSNNKMALAKLIQQDMGGNQVLEGRTTGRTISPLTDTSRSEMRSSRLSEVIDSLTPPRMYLSLRGNAYHEYLSSLSKISKREALRLSENSSIDTTKRRRSRGRASRHYLSTGALMLSPEDICLLDNHAYGTPS